MLLILDLVYTSHFSPISVTTNVVLVPDNSLLLPEISTIPGQKSIYTMLFKLFFSVIGSVIELKIRGYRHVTPENEKHFSRIFFILTINLSNLQLFLLLTSCAKGKFLFFVRSIHGTSKYTCMLNYAQSPTLLERIRFGSWFSWGEFAAVYRLLYVHWIKKLKYERSLKKAVFNFVVTQSLSFSQAFCEGRNKELGFGGSFRLIYQHQSERRAMFVSSCHIIRSRLCLHFLLLVIREKLTSGNWMPAVSSIL